MHENIQDFILDLSKASDLDSQLITLTTFVAGKLIQYRGFDRTSSFNYYKISDKRLSEYLQHTGDGYVFAGLKINDIFIIKSGQLMPIQSLSEIDKRAFKFVHNLEEEIFLVEVSHNDLISAPTGLYDGLIIDKTIIRDALISDHAGNILYSRFFTYKVGDVGRFTTNKLAAYNVLNDFLMAEDTINQGGIPYGLRVLFAFSKSDTAKSVYTLIYTDLVNPAFLPDSYKFELPKVFVKDYFAGLRTTELLRFKSRKSRLRDVIEDISFNAIPPEFSGLVISKEDLFNTYLNVFDIRRVLRSQERGSPFRAYANSYIRNRIGPLNMIMDIYSGRVNLESYRDIIDIEGVMNRLFVSDDDMKKFLFLKDDPETSKTIAMDANDLKNVFTLKKWLKFVATRIYDLSIDPNDNSRVANLIRAAKKVLYEIDINSLDTDTQPRLFSESELKAGRIILDATISLFGHFTIRLLFTHMIDFYKDSGSYKIDFLTMSSLDKIGDYLNQFGIITPSQTWLVPLSKGDSVSEHLFSLFFCDISLVLPVSNKFTIIDDNSVYFGYSPMSFIEKGFKATGLRGLSRTLQDAFLSSYYEFLRSKIKDSDFLQRRIDFFIDSGNSILNVIYKKIDNYVNNLKFDDDDLSSEVISERREAIRDSLKITVEKEIFSVTDMTIKVGGQKKPNLRWQIENLLIGYTGLDQSGELLGFNRLENSYSRPITFYSVEVDGRPVQFILSKDDFAGIDLKIWREFKFKHHQIIVSDVNFKKINSKAIQDRVAEIERIIIDNGGKVRIYPIANFGDKYGFQYIKSKGFDSFLPPSPILSTHSKNKDAKHFVVDFNTNEDFARSVLEYIVALSMSYEKISRASFMFVISLNDVDKASPAKAIWDYNNMICAFDRFKLYRTFNFYSKSNPNYHIIPNLALEGVINPKHLNDDSEIIFDLIFIVMSTAALFGRNTASNTFPYNPWW